MDTKTSLVQLGKRSFPARDPVLAYLGQSALLTGPAPATAHQVNLLLYLHAWETGGARLVCSALSAQLLSLAFPRDVLPDGIARLCCSPPRFRPTLSTCLSGCCGLQHTTEVH